MVAEVTLAVVISLTSVLAAVAALMVMGAFQARASRSGGILGGAADDDTVFLFDDEDLVDATDPARALLAASPVAGPAWTQLLACLSPHFPTLADDLRSLARRGRILLSATGDKPLHLRAEWRAGLARIALSDPEAEGGRITVDRLSHRALEDELSTLRATMDHAPLPVWRDGGDGGPVIWANRAYLDLAAARSPGQEALTWPLPRLFDHDAAGEAAPRGGARSGGQRRRVDLPAGGPRWFETRSFPVADGTLHFALPADGAVQAETSLRNFVQTLTKTFAHLPTGLAIFDRDRRLTLFNPALTDLTTLGVDFLSARPTLTAFFDRLREGRMIPEPKDYKEWRHRLSDLEKAAASGQYQETWTLPAGQTYRVTGRPHPDGAVAFLIDDISAETALTRRFRSDLETGQAVIDSLEEAIAVFSSAGVLVMSNAAYTRLWGVDPGAVLGEIGLADAFGHWCARGGDPAVWQRARERLGMGGDVPWQAAAVLDDGTRLMAEITTIAGGAQMILFRGPGSVDRSAGGAGADVRGAAPGRAPGGPSTVARGSAVTARADIAPRGSESDGSNGRVDGCDGARTRVPDPDPLKPADPCAAAGSPMRAGPAAEAAPQSATLQLSSGRPVPPREDRRDPETGRGGGAASGPAPREPADQG